SGLWPVMVARVAAVVALSIVAFVVTRRRRGWLIPRGHPRPLAIGAGVLDAVATALLLTAVRRGLIVVVAPLAAIAPAFTVIWAWALLKEPVTRHQIVGIGLSLAGLILIAAG